jgi:hypothetical protein
MQQQLRIAQHPCPVVGLTMQEDYRIAIATRGPDAPGAQSSSVIGNDGNLGQFRMIAQCYSLSESFCLRSQRTPARMKRSLYGDKANRHAENEPDRNNRHAPAKKSA